MSCLLLVSAGTVVGSFPANVGSVLVWNTSTSLLQNPYSFSGSDGSNPAGDMLQATDGNWYGTTSRGTYGIFKVTDNPSFTFSVVHTFGGSDGYGLVGRLVQAANGLLYGVTSSTVFSCSLTGTFTVLGTFDSAHGFPLGDSPRSGLTLGPGGNIMYGVTSNSASTNKEGTIFSVTTAGVVSGIVSTAVESNALINPVAPLFRHTDGFYYGSGSSTGYTGFGSNAGGGLFSWNPNLNSTVNLIYTFHIQDGSVPEAGLIIGMDGITMYGSTSAGGANGCGTLFSFTPAGASPVRITSLFNFTCSGGPNYLHGTQALIQMDANTFYGVRGEGQNSYYGGSYIFKMQLSDSLSSSSSTGSGTTTGTSTGTGGGVSSTAHSGSAATSSSLGGTATTLSGGSSGGSTGASTAGGSRSSTGQASSSSTASPCTAPTCAAGAIQASVITLIAILLAATIANTNRLF